MNEYPLITKKEVKKNKVLKNIQKKTLKSHRKIKGKFPKAKIGKLVELRVNNNFIDLSDNYYQEQELKQMDTEDFLHKIEEMGVYGLSGDGYPTYKKLRAVLEAEVKVKYLIVNAVECDPGLIHDNWLLNNRMKEIEKGIQLLKQYIGFSKILIATKEETKNTIPVMLHTVPDRYPMGAEKILIKEMLGILLNDKEIPATKGILVLNVQTVYTIYEAIYKSCKADKRWITVADLTTGEAVTVRVPLNSKVVDVVTKVLGKKPDRTVFFGGGIMSGRKADKDDIITEKTNFIGYGVEVTYNQDSKCKKCGACARKCPMNIKVNKIIQAMEKNDKDKLKELDYQSCIKCGTCTYYCSAGKNTMELISSLS
jgi:Na+-translocating ferredoxin:NAD+ oxidoreductase RnfC subunit